MKAHQEWLPLQREAFLSKRQWRLWGLHRKDAVTCLWQVARAFGLPPLESPEGQC